MFISQFILAGDALAIIQSLRSIEDVLSATRPLIDDIRTTSSYHSSIDAKLGSKGYAKSVTTLNS